MLGLSYVVLIACFLPYIGWTPHLSNIQSELSINYAQAGLLTSITALVGGIILPFAGPIGDKWGIKKIILLGLIAAIIGQFGFAYAPGYAILILARAVSGLGVGLLFVGPYTMAVTWFERERRTGVSLGIMFTSDGIGTVFSVYAFALVLTALGWRNGSAVEGGFLILVFIAAAIFLRDPPAATEDYGDEKRSTGQARQDNIFKIISHRNVIMAAGFFVGEWGLFALMESWMPTILTEDAGWSQGAAGFFSSAYVLAGIITSVGFGLVSDKLGKRKLLIIIAGAAMTLFSGILALSMAAGSYSLVAVCLPLIGLGVYTGMPLALALATESVPEKNAGAVNGFVLGIGFVIGGFVYPYVLGYVKDLTHAYTAGFVGVTIATFILCFGCALLAHDFRRDAIAGSPELAAE